MTELYCTYISDDGSSKDFYNALDWNSYRFCNNISGVANFYKGNSHSHTAYYNNGKGHREDGPAFIANKAICWWIHGAPITEDVYMWFKEMNWDYNAGLDTNEKKLLFRLKFL